MARLAEGHERQFWKHLYGEGEKSARCRRESHQIFRRLFPRGHKESIRELVWDMTEAARIGFFRRSQGCRYLGSIHPDAFKIIAKYGVDYTPRVFRIPPRLGEPKTAQCYQNSLRLAGAYNRWLEKHPKTENRRRMVYVEGIVMGALTLPMAHAWTAKGKRSRTAIDWSHYATCKWSRYIGIPFTLAEHRELALLTGRTNIFEKKYFNAKAKKRLLEILKAREVTEKRKRGAG